MISITEMSGDYSVFQMVLREVSDTLRIPIIVILIAMIVMAVFFIGWVIAEALRERRLLNVRLSQLLDKMKRKDVPLTECIEKSGLLQRQKDLLLEIMAHPDFDQEELTSFADNLVEREEKHYDGILKWTDTLAKLAPMMGLVGTLIPLGPGVIALSKGDTVTLSQSMLTAFDTTITGLVVAGICIVISTLRKRWYRQYMSDLETLVDFVVKEEAEDVVQK